MMLCCGAVNAAQLRIVPTLMDLHWPSNAALMQIQNNSAESVTIQLRVFDWSQVEQKDQLTVSTDVVASPPIASIAAGQTQAIRIVRRNRVEATQEQAFRLLIDELPPSADSGGVKVLLRYSIPVFIAPKKPLAASVLNWSVEWREQKPWLVATNSGQRRARVSALQLSQQSKSISPFGPGLLGYVLPGKSMSWLLPVSPAQIKTLGPRPVLSAESEWGPLHATVPLAPRQ